MKSASIEWGSYDPVTRAALGLLREFAADVDHGRMQPGPATAWRAERDLSGSWPTADGTTQAGFYADLGFIHDSGVLGAAYLLAWDGLKDPKHLRGIVRALEELVGPGVRTGVLVVVREPRTRAWGRALRTLNRPYTRVAQFGHRLVRLEDEE